MRGSGQIKLYTIKELISAIKENKDVAEIRQIVSGVEDVNQADNNGDTPLFIAASNGHTATAQLLLEKGADVNKANNYGVTPLHIAAFQGHTATAKLLIDRGADLKQVRTNDGATPLFIAAQQGHTEIVATLVAAKGTNVNKANNYGLTPLFVAAQDGRTDIVAQLLAAEGVDVNKARSNGTTPLYIAAFQGHTATVKLLLFATKLSARPDVSLTLPSIMNEDPKIIQILECNQDLFEGLRDNLKLIAQADKAGLSPAKYNALGSARRLFNRFNLYQATNSINTSQIFLKFLYEHFGRAENLRQFLETFKERTTSDNIRAFNLNDQQSLLTFLRKLREKGISTEISSNIAEYAGAFSNKRLAALLEEHFYGKEAKDVMTVAAADRARALTQEGVLAVENTQPDCLAELITKLESLSSLPDNITKNIGTYTYHYDAKTGAAAMEAKPLAAITPEEQAELLRIVTAKEARLSERDPTSVTAIAAERSFVSRVTDKPASTSPNL